MAGARVDYKASVAGDLDRLDPPVALRVLRKIEKALRSQGDPGERLSGEFAGLFRLRVGDYRVVYAVDDERLVLVARIAHRREVYRR